MSFWNFLGGSSIGGTLATVAALGFASRLLNRNVANGSAGSAGSTRETVDPGVRLQLDADLENKIPILYGEAFFSGYLTDAAITANFKTMYYCLTLAELTGTKLSNNQASDYTFKDVYLNNNRVVFKADGITVDYTVDNNGNQDISQRDLIKIYFYANTPKQPVGYSGTTPASYTVFPGWTQADNGMTGLMYAIVEVTYSRANNVTGIPTCLFNVTNNMTLPGDVLYDYITSTRYGAGIASTDIDSSLADLNTYANTGYTYTTAGGQTATGIITIDGLVDTQTENLNNMEAIATCSSSWVTYDNNAGKWGIIIDQAGNSIASLNDSNIIGEISVSGTSLTQLQNQADVRFQNTDILDKTDYAKITIPPEDLFPNEFPSTLQLDLPYTNKQHIAIKLGLQQLKQARVDKIIQFTTDYSFVNLRAGEIIDITNSTLGYTNKKFRIISVEETDGDDGSIQISFVCLEYDSTVYDYDIQEYEVETEDGIFNMGSIGKPDQPTVTKIEMSNIPRIVINAEVPSGIVDRMEFWLTFDTTVPVDANRTYIQVGEFSNPDASLLVENQAVSYTYSGLAQNDFFIKVRGSNNIIAGPYSDPTGLIEYVPVQVTDAVNPETGVIDNSGNLLTLLALTELLTRLDGLWGPIGNAFTGNSVFTQIFDLFTDKTGYDLVGQTESGNLIVAANVSTSYQGTVIASTANNLNFTGSGVTATAAGSNVTIAIDGGVSPSQANTIAQGAAQSYATTAPRQAGLQGEFFPFVFGSSEYMGAYQSKFGILTGDSLIFGNGTAASATCSSVNSGLRTFRTNFSGSTDSTVQIQAASRHTLATVDTAFAAGPGEGFGIPRNSTQSTYYNANPPSPGGYTNTGPNPQDRFYWYDRLAWQRQSTNNNNTNFLNFPGLNGMGRTGTATSVCDVFYVSVCQTYNPALALHEQAWGNWQKLGPVPWTGQLGAVTPNFPDRARPSASCQTLFDITGYSSTGDLCSYNVNESGQPGSVGTRQIFEDLGMTTTVNVPVNGMVIFGISAYNVGNVPFASNTIYRRSTGGQFVFPGYTPVSGQTASIQTWDLQTGRTPQGSPNGQFFLNDYNVSNRVWSKFPNWPSSWRTLTPNTTVWPTSGNIVAETIQWHKDTTTITSSANTPNGVAQLQGFTINPGPIFNCPIFTVDKV
ncbi:hypothetical protein UFOVP327_34 [uncultured Caudovirales phage]|uniref:Tip attachment protein J n=1 Tax=uncultured Caudovirales phage TaxID=2100421 RepID=A0A6J5LT37_9CAUD|nr:hypothetical protein UFOVP327_34 [uncultured Caudovirales phage]